jgi:hypothetical protein
MDFLDSNTTKANRAMDSVVIFDSDPVHAENLKEALVAAGCQVSVHPNQRNAAEAVAVQTVDAVVIVYESRSWWMRDLKRLRDAFTNLDTIPEVVCLLRWPSQGPADRLYGDQLNVRVIHER